MCIVYAKQFIDDLPIFKFLLTTNNMAQIAVENLKILKKTQTKRSQDKILTLRNYVQMGIYLANMKMKLSLDKFFTMQLCVNCAFLSH